MIRIVILEDQELLLGTIGSLLNLEDDMEVVGKAGKGEKILDLVNRLRPDICMMDIEMLERDGLADNLKRMGCKVIVLSTFPSEGYFQKVVKSDIKGYLLKDSPSEELTSSIRFIMEGKRIYSPKLMEDNLDHHEEAFLKDEVFTQTNPVRHYFSTMIGKMKMPAG
ncbi:response regulator [Rossellomorea aquimaris]|uniref:response regulator n=1 Tax=Rossellomorea aquimaris TaxID=189382 RepID=UPI0007D05A42|nr:response regulator [Rossellomorea aquimaris]